MKGVLHLTLNINGKFWSQSLT